jgi:magnesium transporter
MLTVYVKSQDGRITPAADAQAALADPAVVWADLYQPTAAEETAVEEAFGIDAPTALERSALEESARFYQEDGALFLTATLLGRRDEGPFKADAVTFVLKGQKLVTVRTINPRAFDIGPSRSAARIERAADGPGVFLALLEALIERIADVLTEGAAEKTTLSSRILASESDGDLKAHLRTLGKLGEMAALAHDSLASLHRLCEHVSQVCSDYGLPRERLMLLLRDVEQLERTAEAQQNHLVFLLDATLGLVGAAQNNTLKALSVATIAFVPPTLIASIFGMNFEHMTWFHASWGPWVGFGLMLSAPAALFMLAKWRNWF